MSMHRIPYTASFVHFVLTTLLLSAQKSGSGAKWKWIKVSGENDVVKLGSSSLEVSRRRRASTWPDVIAPKLCLDRNSTTHARLPGTWPFFRLGASVFIDLHRMYLFTPEVDVFVHLLQSLVRQVACGMRLSNVRIDWRAAAAG
jgi:hypothetical protein